MDTKSMTAVLVGLMVSGLILVAFVPIFTEVTATEDTFTNDGYYRMAETTEETTIVWDTGNNPNVLVVNDVEISLTAMNLRLNYSYTIAFSKDFVLRYYYLGTSSSMDIYASGYTGVGINQSSGAIGTFTINENGITLEKSDSETTLTATHTGDFFVINPNGIYTMKKMDVSAYLLEDSTIFYACGTSLVATNVVSSFYIEGTVDDYTITPMSSNVNTENESSTHDDVSGYVDLVLLDKLTFDSIYSPPGGTETERSQTYSYFLVPYQVTAEKSVHGDEVFNTVINLIPLLAGVGLLMAGVYYFISRK